jgi:2-polyprenyl-3-methyl-5-hydroxy-6-metoxy-1,4-benzoquinol methylase
VNAQADVICPVNGRRAKFYCEKAGAVYCIEPTSSTIFLKTFPTITDMKSYVDDAYTSGVYREYVNARDLKIATARQRLARIRSHARGRQLLDIGCSCGFFLEAATEEGFEVSGVELSTAAISMAPPSIRERIVNGDVNVLLAQSDRRYDVVTAFDIIEHTYDPVRFLQEIKQILVPGGLLVLTTPDTGHFLRFVMGKRWPMLQPMQHTVLFSRRGITEVLEKVGFRVIGVESALKSVTIDYLGDQIAATNSGLHRLYRRIGRLIPARLRRATIGINIGEFIVHARLPH